MLTLDVTKRSKTDNVAHMRNNGMVPGVVYGAQVENTSISFDKRAFDKVFKEAGESSTINLNLDGKNIQTLVHDVQVDPVRGVTQHVDFLAVDANVKAHLHVHLNFTGISPAVKGGLGNLVKVMHEIEIKALPKDIPHEITVDISALIDLDSQITAGELSLPTGVELVTKRDDIVASIAEMKEEIESAPVDLASIEVAKKGKKEVAE
jgi:large subunit ribosomal protein L25